MATTIDTKVVEMRFDNKQFEENAKQSIKTLDDLATSSSALEKIAGALSGVADTFQNSDIGGKLSDLNDKFSFFGTFTRRVFEEVSDWAISKLSNLFNFATSGFQQLYSSSVFSTQQMSAGWEKYADKTSAVQTIMAATGKDMGTINEQLDKLNWFTDETSYNFVDMVSNIGKFTSAGIELEDSVVAMEGIANWAARSGAGIEGASRAMYNLSQAMGMGSLRTQDWMSIENANMATKEFKELAIQVALAHGNLKKVNDDIIDAGTGDKVTAENFRETLKSGWLTKKVLTETLKNYGNFTEKIYGYYENFDMTTGSFLKKIDAYQEAVANNDTAAQAKIIKSLTDNLSDEAEEGLDVVAMLKELSSEEYALGRASFRAASEAKTFKEAMDSVGDAASTAWMKVFESIFGDYEYAKGLWTDFANELYDIFVGPMEAIYEGLGKWLGDTQETATAARNALFDGVKGIYNGLQNLLAPIKNALYTVMGIETDEDKRYQQIMNGVANGMVKITNALNKAAKVLDKFSKAHGEAIYNFFYGIFSVLKLIGSVIGAVIKGFAGVGGAAGGLAGGAVEAAGSVGELLTKFTEFIQNSGVLEKITQAVAAGVRAIGKAFEFIKPYVATAFENLGPALKAVWQWLEPVRIKMGELFESLKTYVSDGSLASDAARVFISIKDAMVALWEWLEPVRALISKVFGKLVEIAKGIDFSWITDMKAKMAEANTPIEKFLALCNAIKEQVVKMVNTVKPYIIQFASVIANKLGMSLEEFWNLLKGMDFKSIYKIIKALVGARTIKSLWDFTDAFGSAGKMFDKIGGFFKDGTKTLKTFADNYNKDKLSTILMSFAACILSIAIAIGILALVDPEAMKNGLAGFSIIIGEMAAMMLIMSKANTSFGGGVGDLFKGLSEFLAVVSLAIVGLSMIDPKLLEKGTKAMAAILAEIAIMVVVLTGGGEKIDGVKSIGFAMIEIGIAIAIIAGAIKKIASVDSKNLGLAIAGVATIMGIIAVMAATASKGGMASSFGSQMLLISVGVYIITAAMTELGRLPFNNLIVIATTIVLVVAAIVTAVILLKSGEKEMEKESKSSSFAANLLVIAAAVVAFAAALAVIIPALVSLVALDYNKVAGGLGILGVAFAVFIGAAALLSATGLTKDLAIFAGSLLAIGAAIWLTVDAVRGILVLAPLIAKLQTVISKAITVLVTAVLGGLVAGIVAFLDGASALAEKLGEALVVFIDTFGTWCNEIIFTLLAWLANLLTVIAEPLRDIVYELTLLILDLAYGMIDALIEEAPNICDKLFQLLVAICNGIGEWLMDDKNEQVIWDALDNLIGGVLLFLLGAVDRLKVLGLAILGWLGDIFKSIGEWFAEKWNTFKSWGANVIKGFWEGLKGAWNGFWNWFTGIFKNIWNWITGKDALDEHSPSKRFNDIGTNLLQGFWNGIKTVFNKFWGWFMQKILGIPTFVKGIYDKLKDAAKRIVDGIVDGIAGAWHKMTDWFKKKLGGLWDQFKSIFDINSPSRVFAWGGKMMVEGLQMGLDDNMKLAEKSMDNLGDTILRPLGETLNDANAMAEDGFSITPVMNMDDVKSNASMLSGLMGTGSMGLKINDESMNELAENMADATNSKSIVDAIKDLREEMAEYSEAIKNIKMVVNSGALVGEIVSDMDYALGGRAVLAGRGI